MKIAVLCGGISAERDVSISSGVLVCKSLLEKGHEVVLLDVYLGIDDIVYQNEKNIFELGVKGVKNISLVKDGVPDIENIKNLKTNSECFFGPNVLNICELADITFIALHGESGENGKLQAAFDLFDIKYTGTGYSGSLLAMNKDITRRMLISGNVNMASGITITNKDNYQEIDKFIPAVVKPANGGSSVGVTIVETDQELEQAIIRAQKYDDTIVIEEYIKGREFSVGILDGKALPVIEIIPKQGFYDYRNKYQSGLTEEICPANIEKEIAQKMQEQAEEAYKILGLEVYARMDFIVSEDNLIYCLEANTLPGMTPTSLLPQEAKAIGLTHSDLCEKIVMLSLDK